ncbi:nucleoside triphosphate pyrophosphohydrolase family protein [Laspinema sp. A4]|uniref:nucleoside triphosphate pyrophosphohydrolase family protein n=1 Tax=Laspinema sp. D2d TaxID=2953686 RepID=UPI0021BAB6FC|nr:nucleoside triphosphate pyrophosphohydrolase family protein [Laspinema sp. D2d]MCT7983106.1 nucleoside triphosphate pyrophosphohydrolase family protein [Laspinema sp. D2d]
MDFRQYQEEALKTDHIPAENDTQIIVPLLGLAGEAGELLSEYKKYLRDGEAHKLFPERVAEELGDLLWYIANLSSKFNLNLEQIAEGNLQKCRDRWGWRDLVETGAYIFDRDFPEHERLPRQFVVEITEVSENNSVKMKAFINGEQIGDPLTDNSYSSDGYRFHDIFHFSYAAVLGWSPVSRSNVKRKRKSNPQIDEVEDGGRAIAIEEGISALVFSYANKHNLLEGVETLDYELLKTIKNMTEHLEVAKCSLGDWEKAILRGYEVWRQVKKKRGGNVVVNLDKRSIIYQDN